MELLEEYKRINRVEREVQQEVQELIDRKQEQREWYEEVRNEIMECFWKVDKTLSLNDIKNLVPVVIKHLENI